MKKMNEYQKDLIELAQVLITHKFEDNNIECIFDVSVGKRQNKYVHFYYYENDIIPEYMLCFSIKNCIDIAKTIDLLKHEDKLLKELVKNDNITTFYK